MFKNFRDRNKRIWMVYIIPLGTMDGTNDNGLFAVASGLTRKEARAAASDARYVRNVLQAFVRRMGGA